MDERFAGMREMMPGPYLSLCVTDTGTGMTGEVIARAFDPFFTTKPVGEGTGLGLSMVYGFARQSGGQVRIYSEVGHGTTVGIYLPRHVGEDHSIEEAPPPLDIPLARGNEIVMVVDDEPVIRMLITDVLKQFGYRVSEAPDAHGALERLRAGIRPALLITDVGLPGGINGRQLAETARESDPELKVLFITGYAEHAILSSKSLERSTRVLTKPFSVEALASRIRELMVTTPELQ
jgi:CheY-like chemotaxis protein